jgi:demethylmenaquinone methyltransferase/2-methoxy-6-polyprenyl-1,4-benzoquinol methylase
VDDRRQPGGIRVTADLLDKREERIRGMFAAIAPWYDLLNHLLSLNIDRSWRRQTARLVRPDVRPGAGPILDLCTGTGDLAFEFDRAAGGRVEVVGADFCRPMLVRAVRKADRRGAGGRVRFVEADAQRLPFPSDTFQIVSVAFGLRNVTDPEKGLEEMTRVCRPRGRVAVLEFSRPRHPLIGPVYEGYFRHVLPRVGQALSKSPDSAYRYLPESVMKFPDGEALAARLRAHGLEGVRFWPLTFGIATLYVGRKPGG